MDCQPHRTTGTNQPSRQALAGALLLTIFAQSNAVAHQQAADAVRKLNIVIVEGEGAVNNARQRVARDPIVQVEDENRKPVAGAAVVFLLPNQGAGAAFPNGARSLTVLTDSKGQAAARGLQANRLAGQYQLRVTASASGQTASASIGMSNVAAAGAGAATGLGAMKWLLIVGAVGGAAAATGVALSNGGAAPAGPRPTVVTPGTPTVGAP
ncbi:MAG: hypothetical protein INH43_17870 [Acidobacteriaceae bacterium]|nr:hypothetical protein [Acidobacteriaceae bacterium]